MGQLRATSSSVLLCNFRRQHISPPRVRWGPLVVTPPEPTRGRRRGAGRGQRRSDGTPRVYRSGNSRYSRPSVSSAPSPLYDPGVSSTPSVSLHPPDRRTSVRRNLPSHSGSGQSSKGSVDGRPYERSHLGPPPSSRTTHHSRGWCESTRKDERGPNEDTGISWNRRTLSGPPAP